jgi:hypothetical protein
MNYYAAGGQASGLKSLAQELPQYGRYNDDMVAHISSDEAQLLKSLGGAGTINPATGLPEYGLGKLNPFKKDSVFAPVVQPIANIATKALQPIEKAVVQPVSNALAGFDKAIGNTIPGGWGTIASIAGSMMGVPTPYMVGLGALTGSGVMRPGGSFNLQGAIMGGALAYGSSKLGEYARGAADGVTKSATDAVADVVTEGAPELLNAVPPVTPSMPTVDPGYFDVPSTGISAPAPVPTPSVDPGYLDVPMPSAPSVPASAPAPAPLQLSGPGAPSTSTMDLLKSGNLSAAARNVGSNIYDVGADAAKGVGNFYDTATSKSTYAGALDRGMTNFGKTTSGIGNLLSGGSSVSKVNPMLATGAIAYGGMGLAALDEQRKYLDQAKAANEITQAQYDQAVADIDRQYEYAKSVVEKNPFDANASRDVSIGETFYPRSDTSDTLYENKPSMYAMGGSIDDDFAIDSHMNVTGGNLNKGLFGLGYAAGGTARFLSGGGDGMSDSIPARIEGKQEARLADGEFVIPADVVSHLGNGSSKAGAKQLYTMMDKVRSARTGRKSQGKQINPSKYMPA